MHDSLEPYLHFRDARISTFLLEDSPMVSDLRIRLPQSRVSIGRQAVKDFGLLFVGDPFFGKYLRDSRVRQSYYRNSSRIRTGSERKGL